MEMVMMRNCEHANKHLAVMVALVAEERMTNTQIFLNAKYTFGEKNLMPETFKYYENEYYYLC